MLGLFKKSIKKAGSPPGTLIHVGEKKVDKVRIQLIEYDADNIFEKEMDSIEEFIGQKENQGIRWLNIDGLHEVHVVEAIGEKYKLHPLVLEDILHTDQRPKVEDYEDYIFVILKMFFFNHEESRLNIEQFSLILGPDYVFTFQEKVGDVFDPVRERLRRHRGRIRNMGPDYLAYALIDAIVDNYFIYLETIGERVESLEEDMAGEPDIEVLQTIHNLKRELIFLRKSVWPLREVISSLQRDELSMINEKTTVFIRDVYDHTIQVIDSIETYRDMVSGMLDLYLSSVSNRMNEVMKVLTIIATIFIPLTFIAGIYGMNFEFMPELKWHWGYPAVGIVMLVIGLLMVLYFKIKKWL